MEPKDTASVSRQQRVPESTADELRIARIKAAGGNPDILPVTIAGFRMVTNRTRNENFADEVVDPISSGDSRGLQRIGYFDGNNGTLVYVDETGQPWYGPDNEANRAKLLTAGYQEQREPRGIPTPRTKFVET